MVTCVQALINDDALVDIVVLYGQSVQLDGGLDLFWNSGRRDASWETLSLTSISSFTNLMDVHCADVNGDGRVR
jgi:hypothetical protein